MTTKEPNAKLSAAEAVAGDRDLMSVRWWIAMQSSLPSI